MASHMFLPPVADTLLLQFKTLAKARVDAATPLVSVCLITAYVAHSGCVALQALLSATVDWLNTIVLAQPKPYLITGSRRKSLRSGI